VSVMSDDLVKRLRNTGSMSHAQVWETLEEAADRIEELEAREEAIVTAALFQAANLMLDGRAYAVEEHGERSLVVADMDARHEAIRALASDPAEVAAIIKKAGEGRG